MSIAVTVEALLFAADTPLTVEKLQAAFDDHEKPSLGQIREALRDLESIYAERAIELKHIASGWRFQVRQGHADAISRLMAERAPRYSRALLETLSIIAYRQPVTRAEIEDIRGVSVSTNIIRTLEDRDWVKIIGHREVPGRPGIYATTPQFLDYFNLKSLEELPALTELIDLDSINVSLDLSMPGEGGTGTTVSMENNATAADMSNESKTPDALESESDAESGGLESTESEHAGSTRSELEVPNE